MDAITYSTNTVPPKQQLEYWNELICRRFTQLECEAGSSRSYRGSLSAVDLGVVQLSKVDADPSTVNHSRHLVSSSSEDNMLLHLQLSGQSVNRQREHESALRPGDYVLCNTTERYSVEFDQPMTMLVARFSTSEFKRRTGLDPFSVTCRRAQRQPQQSSILAKVATDAWHSQTWITAPESRAALGEALMATLAAETIANFKACNNLSRTGEVVLARAQHLIMTHMANPDFDQTALAALLGISTRYLRQLFAQYETTFSRYLLEQRLQRAHGILKTLPEGNGRVSRVAFDCGFNNPSHFTRVFSEHFGTPPSRVKPD